MILSTNSDMDANLVRVVLDTNVIVSAVGFGGKPQKTLLNVLVKKVQGVISSTLLAELEEILSKKLILPKEDIELTLEEIRNEFIIVRPRETLHIVKDEDDNRVIEAAVSGNCTYIITGDKELLNLKIFKKIQILTPNQFLSTI